MTKAIQMYCHKLLVMSDLRRRLLNAVCFHPQLPFSFTVTHVIIEVSNVAHGDQAAAYTCVLSINKHCLLSAAVANIFSVFKNIIQQYES